MYCIEILTTRDCRTMGATVAGAPPPTRLPHNISFLGNTDGVPLIRSTSCGVWPVYLVINELPSWERYVYSIGRSLA